MSVRLMAGVFELQMESTLKFVLLVMADAADDEGNNAFPKVSTICKKTSHGESTVRKAIAKLRSLGYLTMQKTGGGRISATYHVNLRGLLGRPLPQRPLPDTPQGSPTDRAGVSVGAKNEHVSLMTHPLTVSEPSAPSAPELVPIGIWLDFTQMRRKIRKPLTDRAGELIRRELEKLKEQGHDPVEVLEQSIRNGWQDVFPMRGAQNGTSGRNTTKADERRARTSAALREVLGSPKRQLSPVQ